MPVLLAGKSVRTPSLWSFHALVMSPRGIFSASRLSHSYSSRAHLSVLGGSLPPSLGHHERLEVILGHHSSDGRDASKCPGYSRVGSSPEHPSHFGIFPGATLKLRASSFEPWAAPPSRGTLLHPTEGRAATKGLEV